MRTKPRTLNPNDDDPRHGTYAGSVAGCTCVDCREKRAEYVRNYRATRHEKRAQEMRRQAARARALTRLGHAHPDELLDLIHDELGLSVESRQTS